MVAELDRHQLHGYQVETVEHIKANPRSMAWLAMGLGKTVSSLTAISDMMDEARVYGALIVAPLRVVQTVFRQEVEKWAHINHLKVELIGGTPKERLRCIRRQADVYLINYENLQWGVEAWINEYLAHGRPLPFNMAVLDEVTKLKSTRSRQGGVWGTAFKFISPYIPYRVGLTGTPAPNGLGDLFGQYLVLDDGERLGTSFDSFTRSYFTVNEHQQYAKPQVTDQGRAFIHDRIGDITIQMSAKDYLDLPPVSYNRVSVVFPPKLQAEYDKFERDMFMEMEDGTVMDIDNAAIMSGKLRQFANGAMYEPPEEEGQRPTIWHKVHDLKINALVDMLEELQGEPVLLGYQFRHDRERIVKALKKAKVKHRVFDSSVRGDDADALVQEWNRGELPVLMGHAASIGHGLNLQQGGCNVVWFGAPWSLEQYMQFNDRLNRQGQTRPVRIHHIHAENTGDDLVMIALDTKEQTEESIKQAVKDYRKQKGY